MAAKKKAAKKATKTSAKKKTAAKKATRKPSTAGKKRAPKTSAAEKYSRPTMTMVERFISGNYTDADLKPAPVKCPACGSKGLQPVKGRFGPVWRCLKHPECKHFLDAKPTGKTCRHRRGGKACGALMVEGTKTIPDRCSDKSCPNRNPHRL